MENNIFTIPADLRGKYVNSRVSHEIFFIDCINDLHYCVNSNIPYHLIRSSGILRMLLLDDGLQTISKNYLGKIQLHANKEEISGTPLTNKETINIKSVLKDSHLQGGKTNYQVLMHEPLSPYSVEDFVEKICLKIERAHTYCFSVRNIIRIIANKHGVAHLESTFDSTTMDSFFMGRFSPFSMNADNFFLEKIKEIGIILTTALIPLCSEIIKNLAQYNIENVQSESSSFAYISTFDDLKNNNS